MQLDPYQKTCLQRLEKHLYKPNKDENISLRLNLKELGNILDIQEPTQQALEEALKKSFLKHVVLVQNKGWLRFAPLISYEVKEENFFLVFHEAITKL